MGQVSSNVYCPTELLQISQLFKISLNDIINPSTISDDWDIYIVYELLDNLKHSTVFSSDEFYNGTAHFDETYCFQQDCHHFLNFTQWEHCRLTPRGSSKAFAQKFDYFSGYNTSDPT